MALDSSRLLLLLAIREHGSVTGAAEALGRTPPAVSQQLARLEREAGALLVERHPHGARLTPLGTRLAAYAQRIDEALRAATEAAETYLDQHRNRLRLGAFPTAGLALLPDALAALRHRHPNAELSVVDLGPEEGASLVAEHRLDLALVGEYAERVTAPTGVELIPLVDDPIHVVLPEEHRLARADRALRLIDFDSDEWAAAPSTLPNRRQLEQVARAQGFTPTVRFESESYAVAEAVVSAGVAVSFIPRLALGHAAGTRDFPLADGLKRRILAAIPSTAGHAPLTFECLQLLREICAQQT